jgi:polyisoprenoid-binding protein YceI
MTPRKKNLMVALFAGCMIFATAAAAAAQEDKYAAVLGVWDVQTEDASFAFEFEFTLKDGELVGKFTGSSGAREMNRLTFEAGLLKFQVDVNGMIIDFTAVVTGEKMSGGLSLEYGEAAITGTKRKK